jgi:hypothetical protein
MHDTKVRSRLKAQLTKFSFELCGGLTKPLAGFVSEMLFGIQSSQDVKLSNIARSLQESPKCRRRSLAFLTVRMRRLRCRAAVNEADHIHIGKHDDPVLSRENGR